MTDVTCANMVGVSALKCNLQYMWTCIRDALKPWMYAGDN